MVPPIKTVRNICSKVYVCVTVCSNAFEERMIKGLGLVNYTIDCAIDISQIVVYEQVSGLPNLC